MDPLSALFPEQLGTVPTQTVPDVFTAYEHGVYADSQVGSSASRGPAVVLIAMVLGLGAFYVWTRGVQG